MKATILTRLRIFKRPFISAAIFLLALPFSSSQHTADSFRVQPTPALRFRDHDLTTVILVNNNNRSKTHGRFLSVRPSVGILTSTARTFIQDGITTEYATQVLGTTLQNGRLYAQLLKKSSRVLYDNENVITPSYSNSGIVHTSIVGEIPLHQLVQPRTLLQSHNDLVADTNWQDIDDSLILEKSSFVGNTDYIGFKTKTTNYSLENNKSSWNKNIDTTFESSISIKNEPARTIKLTNVYEINANKVKLPMDLSTMTIKNVFSPSGFSWESPYSGNKKSNFIQKTSYTTSPERSPKLLYQEIMKEDYKLLSTVTYYGFADFTTLVGDSVIVFSPSTSSDPALVGYVTSIKGAATLSSLDTLHISKSIISINRELIQPTFVVEKFSTNTKNLQIDLKNSEMNNMQKERNNGYPSEIRVIQKEYSESKLTNSHNEFKTKMVNDENQNSTKKQFTEEVQETTTPFSIENDYLTTDLSDNEDELNKIDSIILVSSIPDVALSSISFASEGYLSPIALTKPSNEEILNIYSSLAKIEKGEIKTTFNTAESKLLVKTENVLQAQLSSSDTNVANEIESDINIQGGATTIFIEDDPFLEFLSPSSTKNSYQTQLVVTPQNDFQIYTPTEMTSENPPTEPYSEIEDRTEFNTESNNSSYQIGNEDLTEIDGITQESDTYFQPIVKEVSENEFIEGCVRTSQVFLTQIPRTVTLFTSLVKSDEISSDATSSFVETNMLPSFDIREATKHYCIQSTPLHNTEHNTYTSVIERPIKDEMNDFENKTAEYYKLDDQSSESTTYMTISDETSETTEADIDVLSLSYEDEDENNPSNENEQDSEELEIIYKTLYTTYTYLTTFFHISTTSVSSRKEVVTNIITSTSGSDSESTIEPSFSVTASNQIHTLPVTAGVGRPTSKFVVQSSDLQIIDGILRKSSDLVQTKPLDVNDIARTYYTTYTYYTTIFVDSDTEIMSRTEIYTNVVGTSSESNISPTAKYLNMNRGIFDEDNAVIEIWPTSSYDNELGISATLSTFESEHGSNYIEYKTINRVASNAQSKSSSLLTDSNKVMPNENNLVRLVTDIRSSSSNGLNQIIENAVFDDQISSESNTDEIIPSATLLLQTSFTTFTYYTTMYSSDIISVMSRLETITNVVTETLQPTKLNNPESVTVPITYFTTFTYWTKLAKEGQITTLSHEETVSSVLTPTLLDSSDNKMSKFLDYSRQPTHAKFETSLESRLLLTLKSNVSPSTLYTTFTYYTTSYAGDQTLIHSRFETVSNVFYGSQNTIKPVDEKKTSFETDIQEITTVPDINASILPSTIAFDYKTIVDAEEISTLYYTTELLAAVINGVSTQIQSSSSTININEVKKALLKITPIDENESTRTYKTGLVRLIKGTQLSNGTTTVYQSKVIGSIIDERYAQIIESTSSFIIEKTKSPQFEVPEIQAPSTIQQIEHTTYISLTTDMGIESSISDSTEGPNISQEDDEDYNNNGNASGRQSFQTRKKTFTPVIRPFASRNRPQFAPKRKNIQPSSATIITRSDFTPTITATPALKPELRSRFNSSRKSSSGPLAGGSSNSVFGSKRFGRPNKSSQLGGVGSSNFPGSSRNRFQSSKIQISSSFGGFTSSRRSGFRVSSTNNRLFTSANAGTSRLKIRPSNSVLYDTQTLGYTTFPPESEEDNSTENYESEEETEITTENARRNNNPLLRFRRPQASRPLFTPGQRNVLGNQTSSRRNSLTSKPRNISNNTTITTVRPRPRAFQRPIIGQPQTRSRLQSTLFPARRLPGQLLNQALDAYQKSSDDLSDDEREETELNSFEEDQIVDDVKKSGNRRRREGYLIFGRSQRSKRQTDLNSRNNFRNRYRRPTTTKPAQEESEDNLTEEEISTLRPRTTSRFTHRAHSQSTSTHQSSSRVIRPTKPNLGGRAQFTLREKDTTPKYLTRPASTFKRPSTNGVSSRRTSTVSSRPKAPRLRTFGNTITETTHIVPRGRSSTSRTRSTPRGRSRNDFTTEENIKIFDGSITVTHTTPIEVTIPIVNGQVTEYKNILTTTTSTEVLLPNQYTSSIGLNGISTLVLIKEDSSVNPNGVTEIIQFILHESPTKTVIFTPTTIRGRKTSFAHIIPSTAYQVENIVTTTQPNLAANAPLANILLSQLLLGNIGLNQPNINPLLALGATQQISRALGSPITEYKTRTTTYVTTVTNAMSTVIPLTFHGKEILTTIFDSSSNIITATEYLTDTIVITPTQISQTQQVNSLLLPLLLQQQLQGQSQIQSALSLQNTAPALHLSDNLQELDNSGVSKYNDYSQDIEDYPANKDELIESSENTYSTKNSKNGGRKYGHRKQNRYSTIPISSHESSIITLYVSGRRPGEFSTVLSTVQLGGDASIHKRHAARSRRISKYSTADYDDLIKSDGTEIQEYLLPATTDFSSSPNLQDNFLSEETQSLESIVGDIDLWYTKTAAQLEHTLAKGLSTIYEVAQINKSKIKSKTIIQQPDNIMTTNYFLV